MVPRHTQAAIDRYVDSGHPVGGFLYAVLTNDLMKAAGKADASNGPNLPDICIYLYNYTPCICWGSVEKVKAWFKFHREKPELAEAAAVQDRERRKNYSP